MAAVGVNNHVGLGWSPITPVRDSPGWNRIIARGCGGAVHNTVDGPDYYCRHEYKWACDDCPHAILSMEEQEAEWRANLIPLHGPPREVRDWMWRSPAVAAELALQDAAYATPTAA